MTSTDYRDGDKGMFIYGLAGFFAGMIIGAWINARLLRNVPKQDWAKREIKMKYGALNWLFGLIGIFVALYLARLGS
jgi:uncharacterized membrane protein YfcA